jgi:hypothetical protein
MRPLRQTRPGLRLQRRPPRLPHRHTPTRQRTPDCYRLITIYREPLGSRTTETYQTGNDSPNEDDSYITHTREEITALAHYYNTHDTTDRAPLPPTPGA